MRWEAQHLHEGPYGLRDVTVYPGTHENILPVTYDHKRTAYRNGTDIALVIYGVGGADSPAVLSEALVWKGDRNFDISAAALWLEDMVRVWAKEESL